MTDGGAASAPSARARLLKAMHWSGRALGALCGVALSGAWLYTLWVPTAGLTLAGVSVVMALLLSAFALFAGVAAMHGHAVIVVLFFLASFFPVGAFLLPVDHWLKWVGWLDLGLLAAAAMIWLSRRRLDAVEPL